MILPTLHMNGTGVRTLEADYAAAHEVVREALRGRGRDMGVELRSNLARRVGVRRGQAGLGERVARTKARLGGAWQCGVRPGKSMARNVALRGMAWRGEECRENA